MTIKERVPIPAHILKDTESQKKPRNIPKECKKLAKLLSQHTKVSEKLVNQIGRLDGYPIWDYGPNWRTWEFRTNCFKPEKVYPGGPLYAHLKERLDQLLEISEGMEYEINLYYFNVKAQEK